MGGDINVTQDTIVNTVQTTEGGKDWTNYVAGSYRINIADGAKLTLNNALTYNLKVEGNGDLVINKTPDSKDSFFDGAETQGLVLNSKKLNEGAEKVYAELSKYYNCEFDDRGNIGKRYRRQDEIGTPFCITYDFESENDGAVTVRDRDTMEQVRVKIDELEAYFADKFTF